MPLVKPDSGFLPHSDSQTYFKRTVRNRRLFHIRHQVIGGARPSRFSAPQSGIYPQFSKESLIVSVSGQRDSHPMTIRINYDRTGLPVSREVRTPVPPVVTMTSMPSLIASCRNHDQHRSVSALHYEAHPTAERILAEVVGKIAAGPVIAVAAAHRIGQLHIAEIALACTVFAAHRAEAFAACSEPIAETKFHVPIWKLQHFADGGQEWMHARVAL